ncbi:MAG: hypothetical protein MJK14_09210 [Rivularia sp. ALOHA_DT_140]|nr:hypothetical protein [Rivularia sp. ALOHA_DT_140]
MNYCPCCKDILLCHISHNHIYWFCPSCWQKMPVCDLQNSHSLTEAISGKLSKINQKVELSRSNYDKTRVHYPNLAVIQS